MKLSRRNHNSLSLMLSNIGTLQVSFFAFNVSTDRFLQYAKDTPFANIFMSPFYDEFLNKWGTIISNFSRYGKCKWEKEDSKTKAWAEYVRRLTSKWNLERCFGLAAGVTLGDLPLIKVVSFTWAIEAKRYNLFHFVVF